MRRILLALVCLLLLSNIAESQIPRKRLRGNYQSRMQRIGEISYLGSAGISSYFGDLKQSIDLWAKPSVGAGVQYRFAKNFSLRGELLWYRISGADSLNDVEYTIYDRNLSFRADNFEGSVTVVGYLYNKYRRRNKPIWNPYAFAGLGFTTNNPKAYYQGEWHKLRPLQTENVAYSGILFSTPFGVGLTYHDVIPRWDLSAEFGYRYTFSDYLDDASTVYPDPSTLSGPLAVELSDRRDEFIAREERVPRYMGEKYRGNSRNNDWYMITALKVTYSPGTPVRRGKYIPRKYRRAKF